MNATDENFDKETNIKDRFVLVDFFAEWCEPCATLSPILEKISKHFEEKMKLVKVNVDMAPIASQKFNVDRIPAVYLLKDGKPINGFVGFMSEQAITNWLENIIKQ